MKINKRIKMGNCLYGDRKEALLEHSRRIDMLKERHEKEKKDLYLKLEVQEEKIRELRGEITELNRKCDQLLLDYYYLEQDYAKCKNELGRSKGTLNSWRNIFSL
jgi:chromosome segregation ATPase